MVDAPTGCARAAPALFRSERIQKYSLSTAVWLFVRDPHKLDTVEQEDLAAYWQASAILNKAYQFTQEFLTMVSEEPDRERGWRHTQLRLVRFLEQISTNSSIIHFTKCGHRMICVNFSRLKHE